MKDYQKHENRNKFRYARGKNGITLIALVITIIVLLILAGVTIAALAGDNGILSRATQASEKTEEAEAKEQVQLAVMGSIGKEATIENNDLKENLNQIENISGVPGTITDADYPLTVTVDGKYSYVINKDGSIIEDEEVVSREGIKVGDYVNYTYDTVSAGYSLPGAQSGYTSNQTIAQTSGLKWKILNIEPNGTVDLISETVPDATVYFTGALGYNNGVYLLNNICNELYSNSSLGVTGRSIDLKDIESQMNETGMAARDAYNNGIATYRDSKTYTGNNANYPLLYAKENGSGINTTETKTDGIGVNDDGYTSPTTETSTKVNSLTVTQNHYIFSNTPANYFKDNNGNSSIVRDMLFNTGTRYWLASRFASCNSTYASFGLRAVNASDLNGNRMFYSNGTTYSNDYRVRPVVSLGSNIEIIACEGDNSSTNMHQISK